MFVAALLWPWAFSSIHIQCSQRCHLTHFVQLYSFPPAEPAEVDEEEEDELLERVVDFCPGKHFEHFVAETGTLWSDFTHRKSVWVFPNRHPHLVLQMRGWSSELCAAGLCNLPPALRFSTRSSVTWTAVSASIPASQSASISTGDDAMGCVTTSVVRRKRSCSCSFAS